MRHRACYIPPLKPVTGFLSFPTSGSSFGDHTFKDVHNFTLASSQYQWLGSIMMCTLAIPWMDGERSPTHTYISLNSLFRLLPLAPSPILGLITIFFASLYAPHSFPMPLSHAPNYPPHIQRHFYYEASYCLLHTNATSQHLAFELLSVYCSYLKYIASFLGKGPCLQCDS